MKTEQRKTFTRAEVLAAVAGVYRVELDQHHSYAEQAQTAAERGEAAEYARWDEKAVQQESILKAVCRVAAALDISETELSKAASKKGT